MDDTQKAINQLAQMKQDALNHQMYGTRYLKKKDGTIVIRTPEGTELPLPEYVDYGDDE